MIKTRLTLVLIGCLTFASIIVTRAIYVQAIPDSRLENLAKKQFQSRVLVMPRRGLILDRNGEPLAINVETKSIAASPNKIKNKKNLARLLSRATDQSYERVLEKLKEKREFTWIKRHLSEDEFTKFSKWKLIDDQGNTANGLWIIKENKRIYPHGALAAHILGDVNLDAEGIEGIELYSDQLLRGKVISIKAEKDGFGRPTFIDASKAQDAKDGENVTLTIDASLQFAVEQELHNAVTKFKAKAGSVIIMNAVTGDILALANLPVFDPNQKVTSSALRRNRAITDGYEPGSTMKPILLAGALNNGAKLGDKVWGEQGSFVIQGKKISEAEAHEKFEWLTLRKVIQVSSNVGAAKLALRLGADKYLAALQNFGFGTKTKIDFPGEISGRIPPRKQWTPLALANIGFGQGILVTPIQMVRAYAAFANGGWLIEPRLILNQTSKEPASPKRLLPQTVADNVVAALVAVTEDGGTGTKAGIDGYRVAGKTGTAQEVDAATGRYSKSKYVSSFIGFPVGIEPKVVIFTALKEPQGIYYASETAAPLFKAVLNATASRFGLPAATLAKNRTILSDKLAVSQAKSETHIAVDRQKLEWLSSGANGTSWSMPNLRGLTLREAIREVHGHKFKIQTMGNGIVSAQVPEEGKEIAEGTMIRLTLSDP